MGMNSFGNKSFMQPNGKAQHALMNNPIFSLFEKRGRKGGVRGKKKRKVFIYRFFPMCSHHVLNEFSNSQKGVPKFPKCFFKCIHSPKIFIFIFSFGFWAKCSPIFFYKKKKAGCWVVLELGFKRKLQLQQLYPHSW